MRINDLHAIARPESASVCDDVWRGENGKDVDALIGDLVWLVLEGDLGGTTAALHRCEFEHDDRVKV